MVGRRPKYHDLITFNGIRLTMLAQVEAEVRFQIDSRLQAKGWVLDPEEVRFLPLYVAEAAWKYNHRKDASGFGSFLQGCFA